MTFPPSSPAFRVVIPARYGSARLPGKPLLPIGGRPMIAHVWDRAVESGARDVVVATDDERIEAAVQSFGGRVVMTAAHHVSGTDRLAEVAQRDGLGDDEIVVNLQGDEPFVPGALLDTLAGALLAHPECGIATLATPIATPAALFDPNVVKVTLDGGGRALYFSRAPIPWVRGVFVPAAVPPALPEGPLFLRHLGLYAYRVGTLRQVASAEPSLLERAESLEQLRAMELGVRIHVTVVAEPPGHGVDTAEDLARAEQAILALGAQRQC